MRGRGRTCGLAVGRMTILLACLATHGEAAAGQPSTRPAAAPIILVRAADQRPWPRACDRFVRDLSAGDAAALAAQVDSRLTVRRLGAGAASPQRGEDLLPALVAAVRRAQPFGIHAYLDPAIGMAADLAADAKGAAAVLPDSLRRRMIPQDDAEMKRANAIAVQWFQLLFDGLKTGDPIGLAVFWIPRGGTAEPSAGELLFVLFRAREVADNQFRITDIAYGDPDAGR